MADQVRIEKYDRIVAARYLHQSDGIEVGTPGQVILVERPMFGADTYNVLFDGGRTATGLRDEDIAKVSPPPGGDRR